MTQDWPEPTTSYRTILYNNLHILLGFLGGIAFLGSVTAVSVIIDMHVIQLGIYDGMRGAYETTANWKYYSNAIVWTVAFLLSVSGYREHKRNEQH